MKYTVVDMTEFTYPDIFDYPSSSNEADVFGPRGGYAAFQTVLRDLPEDGEISVKMCGFDNFKTELYVLYPVYVEANHNLNEENSRPFMPQRKAPFYLYDCLAPYSGKLKVSDKNGGIYAAIYIPEETIPGLYKGELYIGDVRIPVKLEVFAARVPEETLKIIMGYSRACVSKYHNVPQNSDEFKRLDGEYLKALRRMHQNMMYVGGVCVKEVSENKYEFDFSVLENTIECYLNAGMKYFNGPSIGWRKSWSQSTILLNGKIPSMSYEGYCYLTQYLPALHDMLEKRGWLDIFVMGVADEPNNENATEFRALCGLIRKIVPDIKLIDAMSYGNLHGALDIWVPLNAEYDRHQKEIETLRGNGDEIWHYVCCGPRGDGYINRFMDYALLATRYLYWGNYKYNLTGYLHWAANCYQYGNRASDGEPYMQNPFECNCPEHHNTDAVCFLPAGDTHLIYPGINGPWISIRLENQRESAEEYEFLRILSQKNKALADEICVSCFRAFNDVTFDTKLFKEAKKRLLKACSEL